MLLWLQELWNWQTKGGTLWIGEHPSKSQIWKETAVRRMLNDSWNSEDTSSQTGNQISYYHSIDILRQEKRCGNV